MRLLRDLHVESDDRTAGRILIGAAAGLAIGLLLARWRTADEHLAADLRDRARSAARRLRPGRLHRLAFEQVELDRLEDSVLEAFLADEVLRDRGVDIGAVSMGIIELSGSVDTPDEIRRAVALANRIPGVRTVVNRLQVGESQVGARRAVSASENARETFTHHEGRVGGMGRRRQNPETDPPRRDDSQKLREEALAQADRDQVEDEGLVRGVPRTEAGTDMAARRPNFREDELDNQDPHGKHAGPTLDEPPQDLHTRARVGEEEKPVT